MAAISNTPGANGAGNIPSAGEMKDYSDKVGKMDVKSLGAELDKNLEPWQRDAVEKALLDKAQSGGAKGAGETPGAGGGGGGDEDDIKKLLKKLLEGTISQEEMQKLAGMMGKDTKIEDLEAIKGKGAGAAGGSGGDDASFDIQGG
jgi:hypothetical protein